MTNENLNYYELKNHNEIVVNFITSIVIKTSRCRYYRKIFSFNNNFHRYIRFNCFAFIDEFVAKSILQNELTIFCSSINFIVHVVKFVVYVAKINISFIDVTKKFVDTTKFIDVKFFANASKKFLVDTKLFANVLIKFVIRFNVDFASNVDINYDFRNWNYAKTKTFLSFVVTSTNICLNIEIDVFFIDRVFFKT